MDAKPLKKFIPEDAASKVPPDNSTCPVNGRFGVSIAQHGITGTSLNFIGRFAECGIRIA